MEQIVWGIRKRIWEKSQGCRRASFRYSVSREVIVWEIEIVRLHLKTRPLSIGQTSHLKVFKSEQINALTWDSIQRLRAWTLETKECTCLPEVPSIHFWSRKIEMEIGETTTDWKILWEDWP